MREKSWLNLRELLGTADADRLVRAFGGRDVSVPKRPHRDHPLRSVLDVGPYRRLVFAWGGCRVYVPSRSSAARALRDERIRARRAVGAAVREIANDEGLSERQVRNIVSGGGRR